MSHPSVGWPVGGNGAGKGGGEPGCPSSSPHPHLGWRLVTSGRPASDHPIPPTVQGAPCPLNQTLSPSVDELGPSHGDSPAGLLLWRVPGQNPAGGQVSSCPFITTTVEFLAVPPHCSTMPDEIPTAHSPTQVPSPLTVTDSLLRAALSKGCPTGHQPARRLGRKNGLVVKQIWEMLHTRWTSMGAGTVIKALTSPAEKLLVKPCLIPVS